MKATKHRLLIGFLAILLVLVAIVSIRRARGPGLEETIGAAVDAYIYGYPLVTFDMARRQQTAPVRRKTTRRSTRCRTSSRWSR